MTIVELTQVILVRGTSVKLIVVPTNEQYKSNIIEKEIIIDYR